MNQQGSALPGIVLLILWYNLGDTWMGGTAFIGALGMLAMVPVGKALFTRACLRLGSHAYALAVQTALAMLAFVIVWPYSGFLVAWGVGLPLLALGALVRKLMSFASFNVRLPRAVILVPVVMWLLGAVWLQGASSKDVWESLGLMAAAMIGVAAAVVQGWRFAAPSPTHRFDARFGEDNGFNSEARRGW